MTFVRKALLTISMDSVLNDLRVFGVAKVARELGIRPQAVSQWRRVPAGRVIEVERITGISRDRIRPDLYPPQLRAATHDMAA